MSIQKNKNGDESIGMLRLVVSYVITAIILLVMVVYEFILRCLRIL